MGKAIVWCRHVYTQLKATLIVGGGDGIGAHTNRYRFVVVAREPRASGDIAIRKFIAKADTMK